MAVVVDPPIERTIEEIRGLVPSAANIRQIRRAWRAKLAGVLKREAIPAMRNITPKRTGNAANSLRVKVTSSPFGLEIGPGRKGYYLQWHPDRARLQEQYDNIVKHVYDQHAERLLAEVIREHYGQEV